MYDRVLIGLRLLAVCEALQAAQRAANAVFITLEQEPAEWQAIVKGLHDRPEGRQHWMRTRSGQRGWVGMTWWTDHADRRHFRIVGASMWDSEGKDGPYGGWENAPPVTTLYDGIGVYRRKDSAEGWVQVCRCGTVVESGQRGWAGPSCLACHERRTQGLPGPDEGPLREYRFEGNASLVRLGNECLLVRPAVPGEGEATVCQLDGTVRFALPGAVDGTPMAGSPDGRFFAYVEKSSLPHDLEVRRVVVRDLREGRTPDVQSLLASRPPAAMRFSPDGAKLLLENDPICYVHSWDRQERCWSSTLGLSRTEAGIARPLGWSPTGTRILWQQDRVLMIGDESQPVHALTPFLHAPSKGPMPWAFGADGDSIACVGREKDADRDLFLLRWTRDGESWSLARRTRLGPDGRGKPVCLFAFSPDGRWLARTGDGAVVKIHDVVSGKCIGRVGWPLGTPRRTWFGFDRPDLDPVSLDFTPDGRHLILVDPGRVRVVPWALLLNVPESAGG